MAMSPLWRCAASTRSASASESAIGISIITCLPARRHCMACAACSWVGVASSAASTPLCARLSARSVVTCAMRHCLATSAVACRSRPTSDNTSMPSILDMASRCLIPNAPAPARMTFISNLVVEQQMTQGGVGCRYVIKAMQYPHLLMQGTAHDQPHDQLDALRTRFAQVLKVLNAHQGLRIGPDGVEIVLIELLVDEARPLAL